MALLCVKVSVGWKRVGLEKERNRNKVVMEFEEGTVPKDCTDSSRGKRERKRVLKKCWTAGH